MHLDFNVVFTEEYSDLRENVGGIPSIILIDIISQYTDYREDQGAVSL